jgi:hypothetical protein
VGDYCRMIDRKNVLFWCGLLHKPGRFS